MRDSADISDPAGRRSTSTECSLVAALLLAAILLRVWQPGHLAVEHFDEGVYASNLFCPPTNEYPYRHLYAPPLLPALLEWAFILSGGTVGAVMAVNVVAGCLMVPSVWWVGRTWFGPVAGVTAAALATFSQFHILYSRTALTDVLLCLWMLWGVYWAWRAILEGTPAAVLLAGLFASLAWWTKYNGWLTLAISGSGLIAWLLSQRFPSPAETRSGRSRPLPTSRETAVAPALRLTDDRHPAPPIQRSVLSWGAAAVLVVCCAWLPLRAGLQDHGGYEAVAANHARYFVGLSGWGSGFARQAANIWLLDPALIGWVLLGTILSGVSLIASDPAQRTGPAGRLADWLTLAWFVGLLVAIPLYTPYSRLIVPWLPPIWLGTGRGLQWLAGRLTGRSDPATVLRRPVAAIAPSAAFVAVPLLTLLILGRQGPEYEDRTGLKTIAASIQQTLPQDAAVIVAVIGEPGLFFHLAAGETSGQRVVIPGAQLESLAAPPPGTALYALTGPHASPSSGEATSPEDASHHTAARRTLVAEWPYAPSTLVLLDEHHPQAIADGTLPLATIRMYRIDGP